MHNGATQTLEKETHLPPRSVSHKCALNAISPLGPENAAAGPSRGFSNHTPALSSRPPVAPPERPHSAACLRGGGFSPRATRYPHSRRSHQNMETDAGNVGHAHQSPVTMETSESATRVFPRNLIYLLTFFILCSVKPVDISDHHARDDSYRLK